MGQIPCSKLIVLIFCFAVTGLLTFKEGKPKIRQKNISLAKVLAEVPGWQMTKPVPLDQRIVYLLKLDDYINANFSNGKKKVSLYIGYYFSDKKLGAAHDPLVCFPAQGWNVCGVSTGTLKLKSSDAYVVSYSTMVATKGEREELVVYWFQSYDKTNTNTFFQKVSSFMRRITRGSQGNAFVRITTSLKGQTREEAQKTIENFIRAFYPVFLRYIKDETRNEPRAING